MKILNQSINYIWIKENLGPIILIPTLTGGLWQLLELFSIGPAYIRFFSISQLVPDGILLISVFLIIIFFCGKWIKATKQSVRDSFGVPEREHQEHTSEETIESDNVHTKAKIFIVKDTAWMSKLQGYVIIVILLGAAIGISIILVPDTFKPSNGQQGSQLIKFLSYFLFISLYMAIATQILAIFLDINKFRINIRSKIVKITIDLLAPFIIVGTLAFIVYMMVLLHRSFAFPNNLRNTQYLDCKIKTDNKSMIKYQLLYFNDKYIFVEVYDKPSSSFIEVFKFDEFTNSNNCSTLASDK